MRLSWLALAAGMAIALAAQSSRGLAQQQEQSPYWIASSDLAAVQRAALLGDPVAAHRLAGNALAFGSSDEGREMRFWTEVGAENGDPVAQYNHGMFLLCQVETRERIRAEFWLARATPAGYGAAADQLKRVRDGENPCGLARPR